MAQRAAPIPNKNVPTRKAGEKPTAGGGVAETQKRPKSDFVETIWVLFCSVRFAVVLNVSLALTAMVGTIIPQMPVGIENFPTERAQFLSDAQVRYGGFSGILNWAGFYNLYNSLWFRMLVVTVVFSIVMCTLNRWQPIMRQIKTPALRFTDAFVSGLTETAAFRSVPLNIDGAATELSAALRKSRYRVVSGPSEDGKTLLVYADRDRWSKLVTFVSHTALVLVILTGAGLASAGWREPSLYFYPGEPVNVGHGTDFTVRSDKFWIDYYPNSTSIQEYKDTLTVVKSGQDVYSKTIIVNDPLRFAGLNYFLVSYEPVAFMKATDATDNSLPLREMGASGPLTTTATTAGSLVHFDQQNNDNLPVDFMQLPIQGNHFITLQLTYYKDVTRAANENPPIYAQAYLDQNFDKTIFDGFIPRMGALKVPGYDQYSFAFTPSYVSILEVAKDSPLWLIATFFFIMALGFTLSLYTTFTRCWARISINDDRPGTVNLLIGGVAEKNKVSFERDFERLASRVKERLAEAASQAVSVRMNEARVEDGE